MINELTTADDINTVFKNAGISQELAESVLNESKWKSKLNDIAQSAAASASASTNLGVALQGLKSSEGALSVIGATLKASLMNPLTWMAGAGIAAMGALIYKATEFDRAINATSKSQSAYASAATELSELNAQLDTASARISELNSLKKQRSLSFAEESELDTLLLQNNELERQIQLKEASAQQLSDEAVSNAVKALNQKNTVNLVTTEDSKKVYDDFGTSYDVYEQTDIITATTAEIEKLKELQETKNSLIAKSKSPFLNSERKTEIEQELKDTEAMITKLTRNVTDQVQDIQILHGTLSDPITGLMKSGLDADVQENYQSMTDILNDFNTLNLSDNEAALVKLGNFFNGSPDRNFIKNTYFLKYFLMNTISHTMGFYIDFKHRMFC